MLKTSKKYKNILVFDSGIGGLSIYQELIKLNPNGGYFFYLADQGHFPYGSKTADFIRKRLKKIFSYAVKNLKIDCLIIACNTATSFSLTELRQLLPIPIIGVEPVVKPLAKFKNSLLLATQATLHSSRLHHLLETYQPRKLNLYSPSNLAQAIEDMNLSKIKTILEKIKRTYPTPSAIGLSCTHYPLVKHLFQAVFPQSKIIEPSLAVAKQSLRTCPINSNKPSSTSWLTTGNVNFFSRQLNFYLKLKAKPQQLNL